MIDFSILKDNSKSAEEKVSVCVHNMLTYIENADDNDIQDFRYEVSKALLDNSVSDVIENFKGYGSNDFMQMYPNDENLVKQSTQTALFQIYKPYNAIYFMMFDYTANEKGDQLREDIDECKEFVIVREIFKIALKLNNYIRSFFKSHTREYMNIKPGLALEENEHEYSNEYFNALTFASRLGWLENIDNTKRRRLAERFPYDYVNLLALRLADFGKNMSSKFIAQDISDYFYTYTLKLKRSISDIAGEDNCEYFEDIVKEKYRDWQRIDARSGIDTFRVRGWI